MAEEICPSCQSDRFFGEVALARDIDGYRMAEVHHAQARKIPRHAHGSAFVSILLAGRYQSRFGATEMEFDPGWPVFHEEGFDHEDAIGAGGARFFCLEIDAAELASLEEERSARPASTTLDKQAAANLLRLFLSARNQADDLTIASLAGEFLSSLGDDGSSPLDNSPWVARVRERLCDQPGDRASLTELAAIAGVHPCHLTRSFRQQFGCSVGDYAKAHRLGVAWSSLARGTMGIAELAYHLGYADQSHLTREFRAHFGEPPGRVRRILESASAAAH